MDTKESWAVKYRAIHRYGYTDAQIAKWAGATRGVICRVRNGTYPHRHDLAYAGSVRIDRVYRHVSKLVAATRSAE